MSRPSYKIITTCLILVIYYVNYNQSYRLLWSIEININVDAEM